MRLKYIFLVVLIIATSTLNAQDIWKGFEHLFVPAKDYVVYKTTSDIKIDGQANEADWERAAWTEYFNDIEGEHKTKPLYKTQAKMLWDNTHLYIYAKLEEPHIWAYYTQSDMIVYHENDFEIFIDPERNTHDYYEFELNAQNTLFDLFMNKPYRNGGRADIKWNAEGFKSAVHINGTLNNPNDIDESWTVEIAIPFSSLTTTGDYVQPTNGDVWKVNFSRVQWQTEVEDGKYVKKINPKTTKHFPEDNWVWSPQGVINMHYPERWSMIQFSNIPLSQVKETFQLPASEKLAKYLWLLHYKQKLFRTEFGIYSPSLTRLKMPSTGVENDISFSIELKNDIHNYEAILETENGMQISINQEGLIKLLKK